MSALENKGAGRLISRLILAAGSAAFLAACASDTSRFAEGFGGADPVVTNTARSPSNELVPPEAIAGAGGPVASPQLSAPPAASPAITSAPLAPLRGTTAPNPSFAAPAAPSPKLVKPAAVAAAAPIVTSTTRNLARSGNWTPTGGTPVTVGQGEKAQMLSNRYGVPVSSLLAVNGMKSASDLKPGTKLTIPVYDASSKLAGGTTGSIAPAAAGVAGAAALAGAAAVVTRNNTPKPVARPKLASAEPAQAAQQAREAKAKAAKEAKEASAKAAREKEDKAKQARLAETKRREAEQARLAKLKDKSKAAGNAETAEAAPAEEAPKPRRQQRAAAAPADDTPTGAIEPEARSKPAGAKPEFRWPARGRVIQSYRKGSNDGINIAVPEGTPVKAAESGTVAYAGSELKGYGNLVLIRHPNGFVSAYAHNGELNVKRGDTVRRGQTIAKSGRSGNVSSPQLHFELRRGSSPVDPSEFLAGN